MDEETRRLGHARLEWKPLIRVTAEQVAALYGCGIEKADQILSQPGNRDLIQRCLAQSLEAALFNAIREMVRLPMVSVPVKRDCVVEIEGISFSGDVGKIG